MVPFPGSRPKDLYVDMNNHLFIRIFMFMGVKNKNLKAPKQWNRDFPGGPRVKNPPCNTGKQVQSLIGELRAHVWRSNSPLMPKLLSLHTPKPARHS